MTKVIHSEIINACKLLQYLKKQDIIKKLKTYDDPSRSVADNLIYLIAKSNYRYSKCEGIVVEMP